MTWAVVAEIPGIEVSRATWGSKGTSRAQISALSVAMEAVQEVEVVDHLASTGWRGEPRSCPRVPLRAGRSSCASPPWPCRPDRRVPLAGDHRLDHRPGRRRPHRRGHRGEFDSGVLEDLLKPLDLLGPGVDLGLAYLVSSRTSRMSGGGTKEGRTIPCAATSASHSASERSVLRPGTFFTCCALQSHSSSKRPSRA